MDSVFWSWRRKAGAVTLLLSLVVMTGWIRSLVVVDSVLIWTDRYTAYDVHTSPHQMHVARMVQVGSGLGIMDDDLDVAVSWWWIAIPLTLLSAGLLLWSPSRVSSRAVTPAEVGVQSNEQITGFPRLRG